MGPIQKKIVTREPVLLTKAILLPILSIQLMGQALAAPRIGAGMEAGVANTVSDEKSEVNKKGFAYSVYAAGAFANDDNSWLTLTLGLQGYAVKGSNSNRQQEVISRTTLLTADYRWSLWGIEPGFSVRANFGKDSSLRAVDKDKSSVTINAGPLVAYRWNRENSDIVGYIVATRDTNVKREVNSTFLAGLQYWMKESASASAMHTRVEPIQVAQQIPEPKSLPVANEEVTSHTKSSLVLRFRTGTFEFKSNSDKLAKNSQSVAYEIAKILASNTTQWTSIEIAGHSDGATKNPARNLEVSEQRAWTIHQVFVKNGVPAAATFSKGYGASQPLLGIDPKSPENRRIELKFNGVEDSDAIIKLFKKFLSEKQ